MTTDRIRGGVAGLVGAGLAIGFGELWAGLFRGVPSPLASVGGVIVDRSPAWLEDLAIGLFGTADKAALAIGTLIVVLVVGWFTGVKAMERMWLAPVVFGSFALVGLLAAVGEPFSEPIQIAVASAASALLGLGAWYGLSQWAVDPTDGLADDSARRRFIGLAVAGGVGAVAAGVVGRRLLTNLPTVETDAGLAEAGARIPAPGPENNLDVPGISPIVTPNDEFYRIDTALVVPRIDPGSWSLKVHGMVDRELEFTYDDLLAMETFDQYVTLACVSNQVGGDLVGNAAWTGIRLADVLERAGVHDGAGQLVGRSVDDFTVGFPPELAVDDREAMIALAMNGEALPLQHGFPARLVVPGLYGYVSATKWLTEIEITTWEGFDAYWIPRGWAKEGPIKTQSRIDVPHSGDAFTVGDPVRIAGVAWAPYRGIEKVEVTVGNDDEWVEAEIADPLDSRAWVQWVAQVTLDEGFQNVRVRATDGTGTTQPSTPTSPRPDGAQGYHVIRIEGVPT